MFESGAQIDHWTVELPLGKGGMGAVYRCSSGGRTAAVKVLGKVSSDGSDKRFIREAAVLARLDHPNIVKVLEINAESSPPYLVMELVEGIPLGRILQRGGLPRLEALSVISQLAEALSYAHAQGIYHRDIKPSNVLLREDGVVVLVDFGIALSEGEERLTQTGQFSPASIPYSPPEWMEPEGADGQRWDVYSLGILLFELLTGVKAFPMTGDGSLEQRMLRLAISKQQHPPLDPGNEFGAGLRSLVRSMTASDPKDRLGSMGQVLQAIHQELPARAARAAAPDSQDAPTAQVTAPPPASDALGELCCPECDTRFDADVEPGGSVVCPACMSSFQAPALDLDGPLRVAVWEFEVKGAKGESMGTMNRHLIRERIYAGAFKGREQIRAPGGDWEPIGARPEFAEVLQLVGIDLGALKISQQQVRGWRKTEDLREREAQERREKERVEQQEIREIARKARKEEVPRPMWHYYVGAGVTLVLLLVAAWFLV